MNSVSVKASQNYQVIIGNHLLPDLGSYISKIRDNCKAAIVSDTNVWPYYGQIVMDSLKRAGITPVYYIFPAGEASKNASTYLNILNFLAENKIARSDLIIALGGGVVGDITGFAAATFLRGVPYVQVPTTLLAMVDSSVGGKTAIDLPAGKNLVGAFKQPQLVLCDTDVLNTLPKEWFLDGCAEVIKYGMLYDQNLVYSLLQAGPDFNREEVITKCITFKRDVVEEDEYDTGTRQKLNLGHTIGHAIEATATFLLPMVRLLQQVWQSLQKPHQPKDFAQKRPTKYLFLSYHVFHCRSVQTFPLPSFTHLHYLTRNEPVVV